MYHLRSRGSGPTRVELSSQGVWYIAPADVAHLGWPCKAVVPANASYPSALGHWAIVRVRDNNDVVHRVFPSRECDLEKREGARGHSDWPLADGVSERAGGQWTVDVRHGGTINRLVVGTCKCHAVMLYVMSLAAVMMMRASE